jgi:hypothetical protein
MNFYQLNLLMETETTYPLVDMPSSLPSTYYTQYNVKEPIKQTDVNYRQLRKQGLLHKNDPLKKYETDNVNIIWITGMYSGTWPGTGNYGPLLKSLGYNVNVIKTAASPLAATMGRLSREINWHPFTRASKYFANKIVKRNQAKVNQELENLIPDLIVGSSQGGGIALTLAPKLPEVPMVLVAPAWKIFHIRPTYLNPKSIIVHGKRDMSVPSDDSIELAQLTGLSPNRVILTNDGHIITEGFSKIIQAIYSLTRNVMNKKRRPEFQESTLKLPIYNFFICEG